MKAAASLKFCTHIYKFIIKMFLKLFCGYVVIFVVVHEISDCKIWEFLSQKMNKFKPGVFKLYMLNKW